MGGKIKVGIPNGISFGEFGGGSFDAPTANDISSMAVDTSLSTAKPISGQTAHITITLKNGANSTIAARTFAANVNSAGTARVSDTNGLSTWMGQYQSQTERVEYDVQFEEVDEVAGDVNTFYMTLKYANQNLYTSGLIWTAPCYVDPRSGIQTVDDCRFGNE